MGKTIIEDEIEERLDYFESWLEKHSDEEQRSKVVNERTAKDFVREVFMEDGSLRNLVGAMDDDSGSYSVLTDGKYVQELMLKNKSEALGEAVVRLREKEVSLSKALKRSEPKTRRAVVNKVMVERVASKYGFKRVTNKRGVVQYHDSKGRFVGSDRLLSVTDKVISASAKSRAEVGELLKKDYMGRAK